MKKLALIALLVLSPSSDAPSPLVVHEWGTFTSVSAPNGALLDWRPLLGPDDLPSFVVRSGKGRGPQARNLLSKDWGLNRIRMETPVIYFYSDRERTVSAKVSFPWGRITEWYPAALSAPPVLDWGRVTVLPASATAKLPREEADSHYYPARETDASLVRVGEQVEKFLFYRGVGTFNLPLRTVLEGNAVTVEKLGRDPVSSVILFENRGGRVGYRVLGDVDGRATVDRPELSGTLDGLRSELERRLTAEGLYEKEARAMVDTWRDSWFEEGLRVFYLVPRPLTDAVLPLAIEPKPDALVRVLVGRAEILTPAQETRAAQLVARLAATSHPAGMLAAAELTTRGRFLEPMLSRLLPIPSLAELLQR